MSQWWWYLSRSAPPGCSLLTEAKGGRGGRWHWLVVGSYHAATSTTLQRPYQPSTTSPSPPEVVGHLQLEQEPGQGDLLPLLALDVGHECAFHLRHLWSIVGKPGCWRMLGPEPLNSCSGNTWASRMPGTTSCTHQRLLSALDIPNNHNLTSPPQTPKAPKRRNPVLDCRRRPELATTFLPVGRSCSELLQLATLLLMNSNSSSFSSTSQLLISLPLRVS